MKLEKDFVLQMIPNLKKIESIHHNRKAHLVEVLGEYQSQPVYITLTVKPYTMIRKRSIFSRWKKPEEIVDGFTIDEKKCIFENVVYHHLSQHQISKIINRSPDEIYQFMRLCGMKPFHAYDAEAPLKKEYSGIHEFQYSKDIGEDVFPEQAMRIPSFTNNK